LASVTDPAAVPNAVAAVLGITQQPGKTVSESVAAALEGRVRLLIFDNCEHVRLAFYIEKNIEQGLAWAVFEPNDEQLWSRIRSTIGEFMFTLWKQGALVGARPEAAYVVQCDATTTTQDDRGNGRVNVLVGFAPVRPAEFIELMTQAAQA